MALRLITPPVEEPVTLGQAKDALRYTDTMFDAPLMQALIAARQCIDGSNGWLGRAIMPQTWELTGTGFPAGGFYLPLPPLLSVVGMTYSDAGGPVLTVNPSLYEVVPGGDGPGYVQLAYGAGWPSGATSTAIQFRCGWPNGAAVPELIKTWIVARAGEFMATPEAVSAGIVMNRVSGYEYLLCNFRIYA